jgi:hypothetical protein
MLADAVLLSKILNWGVRVEFEPREKHFVGRNDCLI